jgi:hypothetical protein
MEGPRSKRTSASASASIGASTGCLNAVDIVSSSSDSKDLEGSSSSSSLQFLTVKTVQVYIAAIAEIYYTQVSLRLNTHANFCGIALKSLIKDLAQTQAQKRCNAFKDCRAKRVNNSYTTEQFLHLQD